MRRHLLFIIFILAACSTPATVMPPAAIAPIFTAQITETPTATAVPIPEREKYILDTIMDYDLHRVDVF